MSDAKSANDIQIRFMLIKKIGLTDRIAHGFVSIMLDFLEIKVVFFNAAYFAATLPAGPAPTTTTSYVRSCIIIPPNPRRQPDTPLRTNYIPCSLPGTRPGSR